MTGEHVPRLLHPGGTRGPWLAGCRCGWEAESKPRTQEAAAAAWREHLEARREAALAALPDLVLDSQSLCSKWGFGDGDDPDWLWDYCQEFGLDLFTVDWHVVLRRLVRAHLLPALAEHHEVEVYDIDTNHNPIRAGRIDGREVDDGAGAASAPPLTPDSVSVPGRVVVAEVFAGLDTPT
jgi:hypothetical protein